MDMTKEQVKTAVEIVLAVGDAIRELEEVPSGHLYAHLQGRLTLEEYTRIISILKNAGLVTETSHLLRWVAK